MRRFGIPPAPEGCGDPGDGACEGCVQRAARRGRWAVRQLLPLTYRTSYHTLDAESRPDRLWFVVWKMWLGRCYKIDRVQVSA
jgi:hypothetical protein